MKVRDCCTLDPRSCRSETNLAAVASIMWEQDCGVIPVVDKMHRVLGVVTDRDICMAAATRTELVSRITAAEVMTGKAYTCRLNDDLRTALAVMSANTVRRLPVLNEKGELAGVLALTDLVLASRDPKAAQPGDITWSDVMPLIETICRPRSKGRAKPG